MDSLLTGACVNLFRRREGYEVGPEPSLIVPGALPGCGGGPGHLGFMGEAVGDGDVAGGEDDRGGLEAVAGGCDLDGTRGEGGADDHHRPVRLPRLSSV